MVKCINAQMQQCSKATNDIHLKQKMKEVHKWRNTEIGQYTNSANAHIKE